jgi:hypothetical protein
MWATASSWLMCCTGSSSDEVGAGADGFADEDTDEPASRSWRSALAASDETGSGCEADGFGFGAAGLVFDTDGAFVAAVAAGSAFGNSGAG